MNTNNHFTQNSLQPEESSLNTISKIEGSRICVCKICGTFWLQTNNEWDLLLPSEESDELVKQRSKPNSGVGVVKFLKAL